MKDIEHHKFWSEEDSMPIEFSFLNYLQTLHTPLFDSIMLFITAITDKGAAGILLCLVLLSRKRWRKVGVVMLLALIIGHLLGGVLLKNVFARVRPCNVSLAVDMLIKRPQSYSFPSGHTTLTFAAVMTLYFAQYKKLFFVAAILGALVCFSRMYLYVHFPTDILAGVVVGTLSAYVAWKFINSHFLTKFLACVRMKK